ncbi:hypothetical protein JCM5350_000611 [Sporobolomyces pararoseus]
MSSRKKNKAINYAEVDSDVDLDSEGEEEDGQVGVASSSRRRGDTYGATAKPLKKKRKINTNKQSQAPPSSKYLSKLLLGFPFDVFAQILLHLEGPDIIALGKVNKALHKWIATHEESSSIWASILKRDGFELPKNMSELVFAALLYGPTCQACGKVTRDEINFFLRTHLCDPCAQELLISQNSIAQRWKDLHPLATDCVRYYTRFYVVSELEAVNHKLCDLSAEDEINLTDETLSGTSSRRSSTRSSASLLSTRPQQVELNQVSALESYVIARKQWVAQEQKVSQKLSKTFTALQNVQWAVKRNEEAASDKRSDELEKMLLEQLGWTSGEVSRLRYWHSDVDFGSDNEAWEKYRKVIQAEVASEAKKEEKRKAQISFYDLLYKKYKSLATDHETCARHPCAFPSWTEFRDLTSVRQLCKPSNAARFDDETWNEKLPKIEEEIHGVYLEVVRVETARGLIAAHSDTKIAEISDDPPDYPLSDFGDDFFSLATSLFTKYTYNCDRTQNVLSTFQYPNIPSETFFNSRSYHKHTNFRQVLIITAILEAAALDPDYATLGDLDSLKGEWVWTNHPKKTKRKDTFDWFSLLDEALLEAPSAPKLRSGKVIRFKYIPSEDEE